MTAGSSGAPPEAVVFDWGGTFTPWHTVDLPEQWRVFAREVHGIPVEAVPAPPTGDLFEFAADREPLGADALLDRLPAILGALLPPAAAVRVSTSAKVCARPSQTGDWSSDRLIVTAISVTRIASRPPPPMATPAWYLPRWTG